MKKQIKVLHRMNRKEETRGKIVLFLSEFVIAFFFAIFFGLLGILFYGIFYVFFLNVIGDVIAHLISGLAIGLSFGLLGIPFSLVGSNARFFFVAISSLIVIMAVGIIGAVPIFLSGMLITLLIDGVEE